MKTINAAELRQLVESDQRVVVLDVLSTDDYRKNHVPGAINVPVKSPDFERRVAQLIPDKETPVVAYCADVDCQLSPAASRKLERMGYTNVADFEEGIAGWREAGYRVEGEAASRRLESPPGRTGVEEGAGA